MSSPGAARDFAHAVMIEMADGVGKFASPQRFRR